MWLPTYNSLAIMASVLVFVPETIFGLDGNGSFSSYLLSSATSSSTNSPPSLFSTALRNRRMYDTTLQSSVMKLIRELMLTPKVYSLTKSNTIPGAAERRADYGRVLFPDDSQSQGRSASIIIADPIRAAASSSSSSSAIVAGSGSPGLRAMALTSRTFENADHYNHDGYRFGYGREISNNGGIIKRGRPGKVERVPRPIIINGNSEAMRAPRHNRMLDGPAPTVGGSSSVGSARAIKIPQPSVITSQPLRILEGNRDSRGRSLKEIDVQGVRVIVGQRVPDDPEDKLFTWRNGRVIKGMFFPNDPSNSRPVNQDESNDIAKPSSLVISSAYNF